MQISFGSGCRDSFSPRGIKRVIQKMDNFSTAEPTVTAAVGLP